MSGYLENEKLLYALPVKVRTGIKKRLLKRVKKTENCWLWKGSLKSNRYGRTTLFNKRVAVHRVFYVLFRGKIKSNLYICHTCDTKPCVNPKHLFQATQEQNMKDCLRKNRHGSQLHPESYGYGHGNPKLNKKAVLDIRNNYLFRKMTFRMFARKYSVHKRTIERVYHGESWNNFRTLNPNEIMEKMR